MSDTPLSPVIGMPRAVRRGGWLNRGALRYRTARVGVAMAIAIVAVAIFGRYVAPYGETQLVAGPLQSPSGDFLLGTDALGHDLLTRLLYGGRSLIAMSVAATVIGTTLGVLVGTVSALLGGIWDTLLMRTADAIISLPSLLLALVAFAALGSSPVLVVGAVAATYVPRIARLVRGISLAVAEQDYIVAARTRGERLWYVAIRELLPNVMSPILVDFTLRLSYAALLISSLSFLGFGISPPTADWGLMVNENRSALTVEPLGVLCPALCIGVLTVSAALIGDGVTRALGSASTPEGSR